MNEPLICDHCGYTGEGIQVRFYGGNSFSHCIDVVVCTERSEMVNKFKFRNGRQSILIDDIVKLHEEKKVQNHYVEKLQQQIDEQLVELADLREQLSHENLVNETREEYLNQLQKEIEDLIKTLKGQPRKDVVNNGQNR